MKILEAVGKNTKYYREQMLMTQAVLAEKVDTSVSTIARLEAGENLPKTETLEKIADFLNIAVADLFILPESVNENFEKKELLNTLSKLSQKLDENDLQYFIESIRSYIKSQKNK